jgi:uncharacterized membrane-anchored protein YhcB (DUF1043 family)
MNLNENPYESPSEGASVARFRTWRVALVVGIFLSLIVGPIVWQAFREHRVRNRAKQNLDQMLQALDQYQQRQLKEPADASPESE